MALLTDFDKNSLQKFCGLKEQYFFAKYCNILSKNDDFGNRQHNLTGSYNR